MGGCNILGASIIGRIQVVGAQEQVLRAGLGIHRETPRSGPANLFRRVRPGYVDDEDGHTDDLCQGDRSVRRFSLRGHRPRGGMVLWRRVPGRFELVGQPSIDIRVLRVKKDESLLAFGNRERFKNLPVAEFEIVVGHEDLEGGVALANQGRQFAHEQFFTGVADDGVKPVVDDRPPSRASTVFLHHRSEGSADLLPGEADDCRRPSRCRGDGSGIEVVGQLHPAGHRLFEVDVSVNTARQDEERGGVDLLLSAAERLRNGSNPSVDDGDITPSGVPPVTTVPLRMTQSNVLMALPQPGRPTRPDAPSGSALAPSHCSAEVRAGDLRIGGEFFRGARVRDASLLKDVTPDSYLQGHIRHLLHQEDGDPLIPESLDGGEDLANEKRGKPERRLIHQENSGSAHQRTRDGHHLLFSAGERTGQLAGALPHPRKTVKLLLKIAGDDLPRRERTATPRPQQEIVRHGLIGEQVPSLGHHDDAVRRHAMCRKTREFLPSQRDRSRSGPKSPATAFIRDDLPAPFAPMIVTTSPSGRQDTPRRASDSTVGDHQIPDLEQVSNSWHREIRLDHSRIGLDLGRSAFGDLSPVVQDRDSVRDAHHEIHIVLDENDRHARVADPPDEVAHLDDFRGVEPRRRLIQKQEVRTCREGTGDLQEALVAIGERSCHDVRIPLESTNSRRPRAFRTSTCSSWRMAGVERQDPMSPVRIAVWRATSRFSTAVSWSKRRVV